MKNKSRPGAKRIKVTLTSDQQRKALAAVSDLRYREAIKLTDHKGSKKQFNLIWSVEQILKRKSEFTVTAVQYSVLSLALEQSELK